MKSYANLAGVEIGSQYPVRVVGILNVSPESFYSGSVARGRRALVKRAGQIAAEGADWIDIGAMSTAPYKQAWIPAAEERRRLVSAVALLRDCVSLPISVDTQRADVADAALEAGARILNDVSGLHADAAMGSVARQAHGVILMALEQGSSASAPVRVVEALLKQCMQRARRAGIATEKIVLDPGIGFFRAGKVPWHQFDCAVLRDLRRLTTLRRPLLVGASRKSFIGRLTGRSDVGERLNGSLAAAVAAVLHGAAAIRAHDVAATVDAVRVAEALRSE